MMNKSLFHKYVNAKKIFMKFVIKALETKEIQELKQSKEKYDLVIQFILASEPMLGIAHHFNATVVGFSPIGSTNILDFHTGNISPFSFVPNLMLPYTSEMTFFQRLINAILSTIMNLIYAVDIYPSQNELLHKHFPDAPDLNKLIENVNLYLVNTHYSLEGIKPYLSNMIHIGGFHMQEKQILPENLKTFLDEAEEGVVYMSLGSNIESSSLQKEKLNVFKEVFSKLKMKVLWKYEKVLEGKPENVRIEKWLPQRAVLGAFQTFHVFKINFYLFRSCKCKSIYNTWWIWRSN